MAGTQIELKVEPPVAWITLNRPEKLNALNQALLKAFHDALEEAAAPSKVTAVAITGSGEKGFCAGADVRELSGVPPEQIMETNLKQHAIFNAIEALRKPVLAVINGDALGGGVDWSWR